MVASQLMHICVTLPQWVNLLSPGGCHSNFESVIYKHMLWIKFMSISCEIALRWMPQKFTNANSTFVQVMAWCHRATSHCLSQCWPRSISSYGVAGPQCVKLLDNPWMNYIFQIKSNNWSKVLGTNVWWNSRFLPLSLKFELAHLKTYIVLIY